MALQGSRLSTSSARCGLAVLGRSRMQASLQPARLLQRPAPTSFRWRAMPAAAREHQSVAAQVKHRGGFLERGSLINPPTT